MELSLKSLRRNWDRFGETDPFWAILTDPEKKNNRWDPEQFFASGVSEIADALDRIERIQCFPSKARALDFGCGLGRLSQALALHFTEVHGVDISASMIRKAGEYNRYGDRCLYSLNLRGDLSQFPDNHFNLVYSNLTLQHMPANLSTRYLAEFIRVLAPGGTACFQLPSRRTPGSVSAATRLLEVGYLRLFAPLFRRNLPVMEMHGIECGTVVRLLASKGARVVEVSADSSLLPAWESFHYIVTK